MQLLNVTPTAVYSIKDKGWCFMMCEPPPGSETGAVYLFPPEPYYLCFKITDGRFGLRYEPLSYRSLTREETLYFQRLARTLTPIPAKVSDVSIWRMVGANQRR